MFYGLYLFFSFLSHFPSLTSLVQFHFVPNIYSKYASTIFISFYFALLQFCSPSIVFSSIWTAKLPFSVYFLMKAWSCRLLHRRHHRGIFVIWLSTQYLNTDIKLKKKYVFKIFFQPWEIFTEHNSRDGTEMSYFQIPSYPLSRNE